MVQEPLLSEFNDMKMLNRIFTLPVPTAAFDILIFFFMKINQHFMRTVHLAVKMTIHMKCQLIFMKKKKKKIDWCLLQILLGALRVNFTLSLVQFSVNSPEPIWTLRKNVQKLSKSIHIVQFLFLFVCVLVPQSKTLQTMIKGS